MAVIRPMQIRSGRRFILSWDLRSSRRWRGERRRRQAMSGAIPAKIAASFTLAELAVLTVIARQVQRGGTCSLPIDAIAALASVSRTSVQNAQRQARTLGLIEVRERRRRGRPSLTNIVKVISKEWRGWLRLSGEVGGYKLPSPTTFNSFYPIEKNEKNGDKSANHAVIHWRNKANYVNIPHIQRGGTRAGSPRRAGAGGKPRRWRTSCGGLGSNG